MMTATAQVDRYTVPLDRGYHAQFHLWVQALGAMLRVGIDALGLETSGDLAQLLVSAPGTAVAAGDEMGSLEAQKFVGPLRAPVSGTIARVNDVAMRDPRVVSEDPYGEGWLLELTPTDATATELLSLVQGDAIEPWFATCLAEYRSQGSVAE